MQTSKVWGDASQYLNSWVSKPAAKPVEANVSEANSINIEAPPPNDDLKSTNSQTYSSSLHF